MCYTFLILSFLLNISNEQQRKFHAEHKSKNINQNQRKTNIFSIILFVDKRQRQLSASRRPAVPNCLQTHIVILQNIIQQQYYMLLSQSIQHYLGNSSFKCLALSSVLRDKSFPPIGRNFPERNTSKNIRLMRQLTMLRNRQKI